MRPQKMEITKDGIYVNEFTVEDEFMDKIRDAIHWAEAAQRCRWWNFIDRATYIERSRKFAEESRNFFYLNYIEPKAKKSHNK